MNKRAWWRGATLLAIAVSQAPTSAAAAAAETPGPPARFARFQDAPDRTLVRVRMTHTFGEDDPAPLFWPRRHFAVGTLLEITWASPGPSPSAELVVGETVWCNAPTDGDHVAAYGPITPGRDYWLVLLREFDSVRPRIEHWTEARALDDPQSSPGADSRQGGAPPTAESTAADTPQQGPERRAPDRLRGRLRERIDPLTYRLFDPYDNEPSEANNRVLVRAIPLLPWGSEAAVEPEIALVIRELIGIRQSATLASDLSYNQVVPVAEWPVPDPPRATAEMGEHWYLLELGASPESTRVLDAVSCDFEPEAETPPDAAPEDPPDALFSYRRYSNRALVFGEVEKVEPFSIYEDRTRLAAEHAFVRVKHIEWVVPGTAPSVDPYVFEGDTRRCQVTPKNHDPLAPPVGSLPVGTRGWFVIAGGPSGVGGILAAVPVYVPD